MKEVKSGYSMECLKILHGNGAAVVVREWEIHLHGEGRQFIQFNTTERKVREAL